MYNIFILGAGFSRPAHLPLGNELFAEILSLARVRNLYSPHLERAVKAFSRYIYATKGENIAEDQINLEEFISYLDIEHYLQLKGKDHWSQEGNIAQIIVRNLIALCIYHRQSNMSNDDYKLYERFVDHLEPNNLIITFNYDTILENALERRKIPYRLFPDRLKMMNMGR